MRCRHKEKTATICESHSHRQQVIDHDKQILDGRVFRDMAQQVEECLGRLVGVVFHVLTPLFAIECADALIVLVGNHLRLIVRLPVDLVGSDVAGLLLKDAGGSNHICNDMRYEKIQFERIL